MAIELGEKFFQAEEPQSKHQGLIAVISGTEIAFAKSMGKSHLCDFFAFAENAELGLARKNFLPADHAGQAAAKSNAVVFQDSIRVASG